MSERQQRIFYGDSDRPTVCKVLAILGDLTGSESCAWALFEAANEVEAKCGPDTAFTTMSEEGWIN